MSLTNCRFYDGKYPEVDSLVMVNVQSIADVGAYVKLLEYDNITGMILLSELSRRRIRSIQKLIRVGRNEVAVVLRVDEVKGYIDLSKRRVSPEDVAKCTDRYNRAKMVHSILRHVAESTKTPLQTLYESIAWPLSKKFGDAMDAFKASLDDPEVWKDITFPSDAVAEELKVYIRKRHTPLPSKVRADIEVTCFEYEGVDAIKRAFRAVDDFNGDGHQFARTILSAPVYLLTDTTLDVQAGLERMEKAIDAIRKSIESEGGNLRVKEPPKVVTSTDDAELRARMEKIEVENAEVAGDDDVSESDEGMDFEATREK